MLLDNVSNMAHISYTILKLFHPAELKFDERDLKRLNTPLGF